MNPRPLVHRRRAGTANPVRGPLLALFSFLLAPAVGAQETSTTSDPRVGLRAGITNAGVSAKNMTLVANRPRADSLHPENLSGLTYANSDLAFRGNYVYQGNFSGFQIWDVSNPRSPVLRSTYVCATGQGDPSIYGNLLFISAESNGNRVDCGSQGVQDTVSADRMKGVRIFDVSNPTRPRVVGNLQNCRGSHTHTVLPDPRDEGSVLVWMSGSSNVRSGSELTGCSSGTLEENPNTAQFRIDIFRVPLANPARATMVNGARIFNNLQPRASHGSPPGDTLGRGGRRGGGSAAAASDDSTGRGGRGGVALAGRGGRGGGRGGGGGRPGPNQCHDITVYPAVGLAGGACGGYGLLLDITDPVNPRRIDFVSDTNFALWHSATFSNDGSKLVFTDEWGGGQSPRCRAIDPLNWGADAIFEINNGNLTQRAYFKMPAAQTTEENCVAHNGSLVPVPGRDIMVQGWYQGGVNVFDFSDPRRPVEIAHFDRGPLDSTRIYTGGHWGAYWYNGYIYASEIARGLDIFELVPSDFLSQNEIDAAKSVRMAEFNPQSQPKIVWPATFSLPRAYLDQLERNNGLAADRVAQIRRDLDAAERLTGAQRRTALTRLASGLEPTAASAGDPARVRSVVAAIRQLAGPAR
jgi:hypothetical protein